VTNREGFRRIFVRSKFAQICSWQDGKDPLNTALPDVLAIAGTPVLAFRKRTNRRLFLSGHSAWMARKEGEAVAFQGSGQGQAGLRHVPVLSKTTGACDKRKFFKGLIVQPVQTGEDQISLPMLRPSAAKEIWFEPRRPAAFNQGSGGQAFQSRSARGSLRGFASFEVQ
jgi:hypothetical protein